MTPRQFAILMALFGAGLLAAVVARSGNQETATAPQPVTATVATIGIAATPEQPKQPVRVILPSPYEAR